jgi:hypothetical protein
MNAAKVKEYMGLVINSAHGFLILEGLTSKELIQKLVSVYVNPDNPSEFCAYGEPLMVGVEAGEDETLGEVVLRICQIKDDNLIGKGIVYQEGIAYGFFVKSWIGIRILEESEISRAAFEGFLENFSLIRNT